MVLVRIRHEGRRSGNVRWRRWVALRSGRLQLCRVPIRMTNIPGSTSERTTVVSETGRQLTAKRYRVEAAPTASESHRKEISAVPEVVLGFIFVNVAVIWRVAHWQRYYRSRLLGRTARAALSPRIRNASRLKMLNIPKLKSKCNHKGESGRGRPQLFGS